MEFGYGRVGRVDGRDGVDAVIACCAYMLEWFRAKAGTFGDADEGERGRGRGGGGFGYSSDVPPGKKKLTTSCAQAEVARMERTTAVD